MSDNNGKPELPEEKVDQTVGQTLDQTMDLESLTPTNPALKGKLKTLHFVIMSLIPIFAIIFTFNLQTYVGIYIYREQYVGVIITLFMLGIYLFVPATKKSRAKGGIPWYDVIFALLCLPSGLYLTYAYPHVAMTLAVIEPVRVVCGLITVVLVWEALRRTTGWPLTSVVTVFILYGRYGSYLPGALRALPSSWPKLLTYLYVDPNSMLNLITLAAGIAIAFILFGQVIVMFGGGKHLNSVALLALGRFRGGPAKAAIFGTCLIGMITGGAVPTAILSGTVTIPAMRRVGYTPLMAGAIVAVSASGSNIMPPVMGVVAFLMAEYLGVGYAAVVQAGVIPALLFFIVCFFQVDFEAGKLGIKGLPASELPKRDVLKEAWVIIPSILFLVYFLMILRVSATTAGMLAAFTALPCLMLVKSGRGDFWNRIKLVLESSGELVVNLGAVIAGAGFVVGIANVTGFGFNIAYALVSLAHGNLFLLLLLAAISSIILGMGMPNVPAYCLVATLVAPALTKLGIPPMAAHMFIFYFSMVSNWTPPVAMACFAVGPLTGESPFRIGLLAMRFGLLAYILPFLFVYSPAIMLISDSLSAIIFSIATALLGTVLLAIGLVGYSFQDLPTVRRILFLLAGAGLLVPFRESADLHIIILNAAGLIVGIILTLWELRISRTNKAVA